MYTVTVDNAFVLAGENERLRKVYPRDKNEPFFLAAVTLLAADDNARSARSFSTPISTAAGAKGSKPFYRDNLRRWRVFCLPDASPHASPILWRMELKELAFLRYNIREINDRTVYKIDTRTSVEG